MGCGKIRGCWLTALTALGILGNLGCTTVHHCALDRSLAPECVAPGHCATQRHRVHVVIVNGFDPLHLGPVSRLRDRLNECGYAKVTLGDWYHEIAIEQEIERVLCEDPDSRVVLIGHDVGVMTSRSIASRRIQLGHVIDTLIEIAPVYSPLAHANPSLPAVVRRIIIASESRAMQLATAEADVVGVPANRGLTVATDVALRVILDALDAAASRVPNMETFNAPTWPLIDNPAPLPTVSPSLQPSQPSPGGGGSAPSGTPNWVHQPSPPATQPTLIPPHEKLLTPGTLTTNPSR